MIRRADAAHKIRSYEETRRSAPSTASTRNAPGIVSEKVINSISQSNDLLQQPAGYVQRAVQIFLNL